VTIAARLLHTLQQEFPSETRPEIWARIYSQAIPGFQGMSRRNQIAAKLKLRNAVRSRKNIRRRRAKKSTAP
jgi:hypothetical protein